MASCHVISAPCPLPVSLLSAMWISSTVISYESALSSIYSISIYLIVSVRSPPGIVLFLIDKHPFLVADR
ncbi:hypothetical protein BC834DRAFT_434694 [Gloeopeniophorella convolvens]|nr:hypothetical protein BC834DRAFT_399452 [Gloeopeniophorella convolvens]KAI0271277.1 hypothetical protein BC834DRAFT_434694 [Gloeopeniophorella convolvens]